MYLKWFTINYFFAVDEAYDCFQRKRRPSKLFDLVLHQVRQEIGLRFVAEVVLFLYFLLPKVFKCLSSFLLQIQVAKSYAG